MKKNPQLSQVLSELRDWARIEALTCPTKSHWLDVAYWAEGTAIKYKVQLVPTIVTTPFPPQIPH